MKKAFSHLFDGIIWKMDIQEGAGLLAIEWRNKNGEPKFTVIHYPTGNLLLDAFGYGDRWWTLAAITSEHLLLHHFPQPENAQTKGLVAIHINTKEISWELFNLQFEAMSAIGIVVKSLFAGNDKVSVLDEQTGDMLIQQTYLDDLVFEERNIRSAFPTTDTPSLSLTDQKIAGPYFYMEQGSREFWAYHEEKEKGFQLMLSVIEENQIIFRTCLADNLEYLLPETFFIINQQLFFIGDNKQEIVSYFV